MSATVNTWGDDRPSDRAGPAAVALLSVHTSPLDQPGAGDSGGMNVYLSALARGLAAAGTRVEVFTRARDDVVASVPMADGVTVHHVPAGPPSLSKTDLASHLCAFALNLVRHPAMDAVELLHGHYWMSGWAGRLLRRRLGVPLVQTFHTLGRAKNAALAPGDVPEPPLRLAGEDRVVAAADAVIASTPAEAALLRDRYGAPHGAVHVVPPGADLGIFTPHGRREALAPRTILFVGRLQPLKAPDLAVRALAALDVPDARLVIVGGTSGTGEGTTGPADLRALAAELGVADRVEVLAPRTQPELAALYRSAAVVVMPSHSETFGLVALEAQACGTPVVAADVDGLRSVVTGGGTLVGPRTPDAWAAALRPYLTDPALRERAAAAALRSAEGAGWERTIAGVQTVYGWVLGVRVQHARGA